MKQALVLRHLMFEDLGLLRPALERAGYAPRYVEIGVDALDGIDPQAPDLAVILGGPVSVYEADRYPYLDAERAWIGARLRMDRPTLGICLGAQLMAAALGARVYPGGFKEIGWSALAPGADCAGFPAFRQYIDATPAVLHWHGDTFDLPPGARHLASSSLTPHQAFARGRNALALQFHAEFEPARLEQWLIGHALEIASTPGVTPDGLRADTRRYAQPYTEAAAALFDAWLAGLDAATG